MKRYFFGCKSEREAGHFLYNTLLASVWSNQEKDKIPFRLDILDSGLLPPAQPEDKSRLHLAVINGWTVLGMWDRTGDSRPGSNSSFIAEGVYSLEEMVSIASIEFPVIWNRIGLIRG